MTVSLAQEDELVADLQRWPNNHLAVDYTEYRVKGKVLVTRDGLRLYLHRSLYKRVIGELTSDVFLLRQCDHELCVNPYHYLATRSLLPYVCGKGHPRPADYVPGTGGCVICRKEREVRRGGQPNWMIERGRMWCPAGHPYVRENMYLYTTKSGGVHRKCRTCTLARAAGEDPTQVVYVSG